MIRWLLDGPLKGFPDLPPVWLLGFMAAAWRSTGACRWWRPSGRYTARRAVS
jgi:hypothetical protein